MLSSNLNLTVMASNKRVYIIAKVTGLSQLEVSMNYQNAKVLVQSFGYEPVSPVDYVPLNTDWHSAMRICIPLLLNCDAYIVVDALHTTPGGLIEDTIAGWVGLPRIYLSKL